MITPHLYIVIIIILLLVLYGLLYFPVVGTRKRLGFVEQVKEIRRSANDNALLTELEVKEQALRAFSQEIHDNIGHVLALAKLHLSTIQIRNNPLASTRLNQSIELLNRAVNDLRDLSRSMCGTNIGKAGLIEAVSDDLAIIRSTGQLSAAATVYGTPVVLGLAREIVIYRIVQEALSNVIRHSAATEVIVVMNFMEDDFHLSIIDNGTGFKQEKLFQTGHDGAGLANMFSRAQLIGGVLRVETNPGCGTRINFVMPCQIGVNN